MCSRKAGKPFGGWKRAAMLIGLVAVLLAVGALLMRYYPLVEDLAKPENMAVLREQLQSFGWAGALLLCGVQILQVLSGIIPALPIQLAAGLSYGAWLGLLICLGGVAVGSIIVFSLVKKYGQPLVNKHFSAEKQSKLSFLQDAKTLEPIVFILYLIPAMPKDVFTYLAALTPLSLQRYLVLTLVARAPTIFCTVFASNSMIEGDYSTAIIVFCITASLGILSMLFRKRIMALLERTAKK